MNIKKILIFIRYHKNFYSVFGKHKDIITRKIFNEDYFVFQRVYDINKKYSFKGYKKRVRPSYITIVKNGKCIVGREEVYTESDRVLFEITSQRINPNLSTKQKLVPCIKYDCTVCDLRLAGLDNNYYHLNVEFFLRWWIYYKSNEIADLFIMTANEKLRQELLEIIGIKSDKIITLPENTIIQAKKIIVPALVNNYRIVKQDDYVLYWKEYLPLWSVQAYSWILQEVKNKYCCVNTYDKIYVSRNKGTVRTIENEDKLYFFLRDLGFTRVYLEENSFMENVYLFNKSKFIIAPHGAGLVHLSYCEEKTTVLELYAESYYDPSFRIQAQVNNLDYNFLICETHDVSKHPQQRNIFISDNNFLSIKRFVENKLLGEKNV